MKTPPPRIAMLGMDFDGVLTDDRVLVGEDGAEYVMCSRADGMGIAMLRRAGVKSIILSSETNPVVEARGRKLGVPVFKALTDKAKTLRATVEEHGLVLSDVAFIGNDINDVECLEIAGFSAVPADAHCEAKRVADLVLSRPGGHGAVRELIDLILGVRSEAPSVLGSAR